jgi:exodeoxyribonuclease VII large subunit
LQRQGHALELLQQRLVRAVHRGVESKTLALQRVATRIPSSVALTRSRQSMRLDTLSARLAALDPSRVLSRGYAWLADEQGTPVLSVRRLASGQALRAVLHDGSAQVIVKRVEDDSTG